MSENNEIEKRDATKANIWVAVALGVIALTVAITPFFYLNSAVING